MGTDFEFIIKLYENTKQFYNNGFFDEKHELFSHYKPDMELDDCIVELFFEIQSCLKTIKNNQTIKADDTFFNSRKKCFILVKDLEECLTLPINYQITRIEKVNGLKTSWILADGFDSQIMLEGKTSSKVMPVDWLLSSYSPSASFCEKLYNSSRGRNPRNWRAENISESEVGDNLFYFNREISFLSVVEFGWSKHRIFSIYDKKMEENRKTFWHLLSKVLFGNLVGNSFGEQKYIEPEERLKLIEMKSIFTHPKFKRFMPFTLIENLYQESTLIHNYIKLDTFEKSDDSGIYGSTIND